MSNASKSKKQLTRTLLTRCGQTYAEETGIRLRDTPAPLFQLLVLATLLSARISAGHAISAAKAMKKHFPTPRKMADASWQQRVDVLTRSGYKRYDESAARMLGESARHLLDAYGGDLRGLRKAADGDVDDASRRLQEFKGIGTVGAAIFLREVQGVWKELQPYVDDRVLRAAKRLELGSEAKALVRLVDPDDLPRLEAALMRVDLTNAYHAFRARAG